MNAPMMDEWEVLSAEWRRSRWSHESRRRPTGGGLRVACFAHGFASGLAVEVCCRSSSSRGRGVSFRGSGSRRGRFASVLACLQRWCGPSDCGIADTGGVPRGGPRPISCACRAGAWSKPADRSGSCALPLAWRPPCMPRGLLCSCRAATYEGENSGCGCSSPPTSWRCWPGASGTHGGLLETYTGWTRWNAISRSERAAHASGDARACYIGMRGGLLRTHGAACCTVDRRNHAPFSRRR